MSIFLEITQLENGDIVLREADEDTAEQLQGLDSGQRLTAANGTDGDQKDSALSSSLGRAEHGSTARAREPLVRISFSDEVRDMLGSELVGVAEAMIDAATDYLGGETVEVDAEEIDLQSPPAAPVIH